MENDATVWVVLISAGAALAGALGSQLVGAWGSLKSKRLELLYARKADAYADLLMKIGEFSFDPSDRDKYLHYLASFQGALLFASPEVAEALRGRLDGLNINAQRLRLAEDNTALDVVRSTTWFDAVAVATKAMNVDLRHIAG